MTKKTVVEQSPYQKEIEEMILEGKSDRYISNWLSEQDPPAKISYSTIYNYRKKKFNVQENAVKKYREKQSRKRLDKAVEKKVTEIEYCDDIIQKASSVGLNVDPQASISELDIKKLGLQAVKVKHDITKDEPEHNINVNVGIQNDIQIPRDPGLRARGRAFIQSLRSGQVESSDPGNGDKPG